MHQNKVLAKAPHPALSSSTNQMLLDLELNMAQYCRVLSSLVDSSGITTRQVRELRQLLQEQELVQEAQDLI